MNSRKLPLLGLAALLLPACEVDVDDDSAVPAVTRRISVDAAGVEANRASENPDVTPDGRYVVFQSAASNLVAGDGNGRIDIFRKDLATGEVLMVSTSEAGLPGDGDSTNASVSEDGRVVAFQSLSTNLAPGGTDLDAGSDVYVKDLSSGAVTHVSQSFLGGPPAGLLVSSGSPRLSRGGRYVVFVSDGEDLVDDPLILSPTSLVYLRDLAPGGGTVLVSRDTAGEAPLGPCLDPSVSDDGRWVAFASAYNDLVAGDANGASDVFVRDLLNGTTQRISVEDASNPDGLADGANANGASLRPRISPDGRFVVFESGAPDLVAEDGNGFIDVFLWDRQAPSPLRAVSAGLGGGTAFGESTRGVVSPDGRYVLFRSSAPNLVPGDTNGTTDHFWRDLGRGLTYRVSVRTGGAQSLGNALGSPALSADGRWAFFASDGVDLSIGDSNGSIDLFVRGPHY